MNNKNLKITVVGIGSGAQNIIDYLFLNNKSENIEFALINSDKNFLEQAKTENKLLIHGDNENFYGLGCGGDTDTGKQYAEFCINKIENLFNGTDIAVLISCFGGGCGTGATPVIAEILKDKGIKTIAIITKPFAFEGELRSKRTTLGIEKIKNLVDKLILTGNQDLINILPANTTLKESWDYANENIAKLFEKEIIELTK